jgi:hypothetical protein
MNLFFAVVVLALPSLSFGAVDFEKDRQAILAQTGCFKVTFEFKETETLDPNTTRSPDYKAGAYEWILVNQDGGKKLSLQHVLISDGMPQKHWRQVWEYEPSKIFEFQGRSTWKEIPTIDAVGKWAQRVFQVEDSPRYQSVAAWKHEEGKSTWVAVAPAPLPRREMARRRDYQVLNRENTVTVDPSGWTHDEKNDKVRLGAEGQSNQVVGREIGQNKYVRVPDAQCELAQKEWTRTSRFWNLTQKFWDHVLGHHPVLKLRPLVNNQPIYNPMFDLADKISNQIATGMEITDADIIEQAHDIIHEYVVHEDGQE